MASRAGRVVLGVLIAAGLLIGTRAHADESAAIVYVAPAACPDATAFTAAVQARAPRALIAAGAPRTFTITIRPSVTGFDGALATEGGGDDRALTAARCEDLVAALALVTALAIDPSAALDDPPPPPRVATPRRGWAAAIASAELDVGVTPDPLLAAGLGVRLGRRGLGHVELGAVVGRDRTTTAGGDAQFTWLVGRAVVCAQLVARRIALDGCGRAEVGMLDARGVDVVRAQHLRRAWLAVAAGGRAQWPANAMVFAELRVEVEVPLVRDRFVFAPDIAIHQAPVVIPTAALGLGVRFP